MGFSYSSDADMMTAASMKKTMNNNGVWPSKGMRYYNFVARVEDAEKEHGYYTTHTHEEADSLFNIDVPEGCVTITVNGLMSWVNYGSRSKIPVVWVYVVDTYGVVAAYKLGGRGNLRVGWSPDASKTKLEWKRPEDFEVPEWMETADESPDEPTPVALEAGRYRVRGKIITIRIEDNPFAYNSSVTKFLLELSENEDETKRIWGTAPRAAWDCETGDIIEFDAEIVPKDDGFAIYKRPTKVKVIETNAASSEAA